MLLLLSCQNEQIPLYQTVILCLVHLGGDLGGEELRGKLCVFFQASHAFLVNASFPIIGGTGR